MLCESREKNVFACWRVWGKPAAPFFSNPIIGHRFSCPGGRGPGSGGAEHGWAILAAAGPAGFGRGRHSTVLIPATEGEWRRRCEGISAEISECAETKSAAYLITVLQQRRHSILIAESDEWRRHSEGSQLCWLPANLESNEGYKTTHIDGVLEAAVKFVLGPLLALAKMIVELAMSAFDWIIDWIMEKISPVLNNIKEIVMNGLMTVINPFIN